MPVIIVSIYEPLLAAAILYRQAKMTAHLFYGTNRADCGERRQIPELTGSFAPCRSEV
jgi:hypothetical protein